MNRNQYYESYRFARERGAALEHRHYIIGPNGSSYPDDQRAALFRLFNAPRGLQPYTRRALINAARQWRLVTPNPLP